MTKLIVVSSNSAKAPINLSHTWEETKIPGIVKKNFI
jgi:hypothetical protein